MLDVHLNFPCFRETKDFEDGAGSGSCPGGGDGAAAGGGAGSLTQEDGGRREEDGRGRRGGAAGESYAIVSVCNNMQLDDPTRVNKLS